MVKTRRLNRLKNRNVNIRKNYIKSNKINNSNNTNSMYPKYSRKKWNSDKMIKRGHNCYTYFLDKIQDDVINDCKNKHNFSSNDTRSERLRKIRNRKPCGKPQPGYYAGVEKYDKKNTSCSLLHNRVLADNPHIRPVKFNGYQIPDTVCNDDEYMGALVVHPKRTYHFYRRDGNGEWSHKPGSLQTTRYDAKGKKIINPKYADRNYKNFKYTNFCNFYCIPKDERKRKYSLRIRKSGPLYKTRRKSKKVKYIKSLNNLII